MKRSEFVSALAEKGDLERDDAEKALNAFIDVVTECLANGENIQILGFGTFETRQRVERQCRNPRTGEPITVPAANVPVFKASKGLKDAVAGK